MLSVGDIACMIVDEFNLTSDSEQVVENQLEDVVENYFIKQIGDVLLAYTWMEELVSEIKNQVG